MVGLAKLLSRNDGLLVVCMDAVEKSVEFALEQTGIANLVLGVRAAKGLEFTDVVLVDFFCGVPEGDQAVWKSLFTGAGGHSIATTHPHIELQIKLTRSCNLLWRQTN
eukprot:gene24961-biopygen21567